jgi:Family of unknown function (DUF6893)
VRRVLMLVLLGLFGFVIFKQWPDISRYLKMKRLSTRPELVPAEGSKAYVQDERKAEREGVGQFDAAKHGAPPDGPMVGQRTRGHERSP